ncbi:MAG: hypothetical protein JNM07_00385 [Phycisphaerae bacterium]|nr:hypothetical protein [Phycisphaerae bacterium]
MFRTTLLLSTLVLAAPALASPEPADVIAADQIRSATPVTINGLPYQAGSGTRADVLVFDNTDLTRSVFSSGAQPNRAIDDGSFAGGPVSNPGAGLSPTVDKMRVSFRVLPAAGTTGFDMVVQFFDTLTPNASPVNTDFIAGFRVGYGAVAQGAYYTDLDLGANAITIPFGDDDWACEVLFLQPGTDTLMATGQITVLFQGSGDNTRMVPAAGASEDVYWRDSNNNGTYDDPTDARTFTGDFNEAIFFINMSANLGCAGDWNGDTSVDDFDFFDFLNDFNNNNADFNGDTSTDDFDFFDFMNAFNTPC